MAQPTPAQISHIADFLKEIRADLTIDDVMELAQRMAASLDESVAHVDALLHEEFRSIARAIGDLKQDLVALRPDQMRYDRIPEAGRELDAVVEATEEASTAIMNAAEEIMGADFSDPGAYKAMVDEKMIVIFEACAFQDITGQRIRKVAKTLEWIDARISEISTKLKVPGAPSTVVETEEERRARELILHGPQLKGAGVTQANVDDFFGAGSNQDDIDAMFG